MKRIDAKIRKRIREKLRWFVDNFDNVVPSPLSEPWKGFFKLRIGGWRVVYEVESSYDIVVVHLVDHRDKIYKRK